MEHDQRCTDTDCARQRGDGVTPVAPGVGVAACYVLMELLNFMMEEEEEEEGSV